MPRFQLIPPEKGLWWILAITLLCIIVRHSVEVMAEQETYLSVTITTDRKGAAFPKFIDAKGAFHGDRTLNLTPGTDPHPVRVLMPRGHFQGIYLKFAGVTSKVSIREVWICNTAGTMKRKISLAGAQGLPALALQKLPEGGLSFDLVEGEAGNAVAIRVPGELIGNPEVRLLPNGATLLTGLLAGLLAWGAQSLVKLSGERGVWPLAQKFPKCAIVTVGAVAALISIWPVLLAQRGFVGPLSGGYIVYEGEITVPGQGERILSPPPNSVDVAAVQFTALGQMRQAAQALWRDGEILLWDRFNGSGATYLGQGMFLYLCPYIWPVLLMGGTLSSWTWAFVIAKVIFPGAMGLYLRRIGVSLPVVLGLAAACGFIGTFEYRTGHFAFLAAAAFPLVMLGLDGVLEPGGPRWKRLAFGACWLVGSLACFASGALKEGVFVMLTGNGLVLALRLAATRDWRTAGNYILLAMALAIPFFLITAPVWMTFLGSMENYTSIYYRVPPLQKPFASLLSIFDDFFGRIYSNQYGQFSPGLNLTFLPGYLFALAACITGRQLRQVLIPVLASLVPLCLVYSIIPGRLLMDVPFLGQIYTFCDAFGQCAIPLLIVASARGWDLWLGLQGTPAPAWFNRVAYGIFAVLVVAFTVLPLQRASHLNFPVFLGFGLFIIANILTLPLLLRVLATWKLGPRTFLPVLTAIIFICAIGWGRHVYMANTSLNPWFYVLPERIPGQAASSASEWVRQRVAKEPARVIGIDDTFTAGINVYYGLEGVATGMPLWQPDYHYFYRDIPGGMVAQFWNLSIPFENIRLATPYLEFLNCRYVFCMPGQDFPNGGPPIIHRSDMEVRELPLAWPRAFFVDQVEVIEDRPALMARVSRRTGPFCSVRSKERLSHLEMTAQILPPAPVSAPSKVAAARNYRLKLNSTAFTVDAVGPGVIVLHEQMDLDNFQVTLNGQAVRPFLVNQTFRGIYVNQAGTYNVLYQYWPPGLTLRLWMAAAGVVLMVGFGASTLVYGKQL